MTLDQIVDDFIRTRRASADADLGEFRKLASLKQAIRHATLCHWLPEFKRHPHQYRIPGPLLQAAERKLQRAAGALSIAPNFEVLHDAIYRRIRRQGIGSLTIYDIAQRIGAFLAKAPRLVYLHRGTCIGARRLGFTGDTLDPHSLPPAFSRLRPAEIEDCLCIYSDYFLSSHPLTEIPRQRRCRTGSAGRRSRKC
jgi:hypothetical protein